MKRFRSQRFRKDLPFNIVVLFLLTIFLVFALYPLIYVLSCSLSSSQAVLKHEVVLFPKGIEFYAYKRVFQDKEIWTSYLNTIIYTFGGTAYNMILTVLAAYPLSRKGLPGRRIFLFLITFTMLFSAGMIPTFLMVKKLKMLDTMWAMMIPCAVSQYNLIIMRSAFEGVPGEMEESAKLDGAGEFTILLRIMMPLVIPTFMTILLFYFIGHWNSFYTALIYLRTKAKYPLQLILRSKLIDETDASTYQFFVSGEHPVAPYSYKCALIMVSMLPMLIVYPFVQRFFVGGITLGAVKG